VLHPAASLFPAPSKNAASCLDRGNRRKHRGPTLRRRCGLFWRPLSWDHPRHTFAHDSKPMPSLPRVRIPIGSILARQKDHRSTCLPEAWFSRRVIRLSPTRFRLRSDRRERRFEFIAMWVFLVFFLYRMRRVGCRQCATGPRFTCGFLLTGHEWRSDRFIPS
jgi:hypothetical protein